MADLGHAATCPIPCCTSPDDPYVAGLPGSTLADPQAGLPVRTGLPAYEFWLTFGVNYSRVVHPRGMWVHPDGWVAIVAPSYAVARAIVVDLFGLNWSGLYDADEVNPVDHPLGELLRIVVPHGLIDTEDHR